MPFEIDPALAEFVDPLSNHPAASIPMPGEIEMPEDYVGRGKVIEMPEEHVVGGNPAQPPPSSTPTSTSQSSKVQAKVGTDYRGMTDAGLTRAGRVMGGADKQAEARVAEERAFTQGQLEDNRINFERVQAAQEEARVATQRFQEFDSQVRQQEIDFQKGAAELEARLAGEAEADRQQYVSAYKEQLAVVKQLALQSGNPMGKLSQGEALGLAGAQFAQGFLAAQGINIDVAGQVDRWVERSINEHQLKIQNARDAANDQLHLYEIARQNSQDEWEARQRYRGFVIAGLQSSIALNASRFQSDIAMARANEQIARLAIEGDATERAIANSFFERQKDIYKQEYDRAYQQGQLAIERKKAEAEMLRAQAAAIKAKADAEKEAHERGDTAGLVVPDIEYATNPDGTPMTDDKGNKILQNRWRVNTAVAKDPVLARQVWKEASEARQHAADYDDKTKKMMDAHTEAAKLWKAAPFHVRALGWEGIRRWDESGAAEKFVRSVDDWAMARVLAFSGKAATDAEFVRHQKQAYKEEFLNRNGEKAEKSHAQLRLDGIQQFERHMESLGMEEIPEGDQHRIGKSVQSSPVATGESTAILDGEKPIEGFAGVTLGKVVTTGSKEVPSKAVSGVWAQYQRQHQENPTLGQPKFAKAIDQLAAAYVRPNWFRTRSQEFGVDPEKAESPLEIRREAYTAINAIARGVPVNGKTPPADAVMYAQFVRNKLEADPALKALRDEAPDDAWTAKDVEESPFINEMDFVRK